MKRVSLWAVGSLGLSLFFALPARSQDLTDAERVAIVREQLLTVTGAVERVLPRVGEAPGQAQQYADQIARSLDELSLPPVVDSLVSGLVKMFRFAAAYEARKASENPSFPGGVSTEDDLFVSELRGLVAVSISQIGKSAEIADPEQAYVFLSEQLNSVFIKYAKLFWRASAAANDLYDRLAPRPELTGNFQGVSVEDENGVIFLVVGVCEEARIPAAVVPDSFQYGGEVYEVRVVETEGGTCQASPQANLERTEGFVTSLAQSLVGQSPQQDVFPVFAATQQKPPPTPPPPQPKKKDPKYSFGLFFGGGTSDVGNGGNFEIIFRRRLIGGLGIAADVGRFRGGYHRELIDQQILDQTEVRVLAVETIGKLPGTSIWPLARVDYEFPVWKNLRAAFGFVGGYATEDSALSIWEEDVKYNRNMRNGSWKRSVIDRRLLERGEGRERSGFTWGPSVDVKWRFHKAFDAVFNYKNYRGWGSVFSAGFYVNGFEKIWEKD